jgi:predicted Zn-dependent protease
MRILSRIILLVSLVLGPAVTTTSFALSLDELKQATEKLKQKASQGQQAIEKARGKLSTEDEIEVGGNLIAGLLGAAPLVDDAGLQQYVNDVGFWVASQSRRSDLPWSFQLAGVLAHEIAHVVRKHHLKALQKTMKREFWADLGVKAAGRENKADELGKLINSGVQLYASGLDRKYEYDADLRAVVLAARAGYDPYALLDVLTTIDSINPDASELTVFMNTHPPTAQRLDRLGRKMDGRLDDYASGRHNAARFRRVGNNP